MMLQMPPSREVVVAPPFVAVVSCHCAWTDHGQPNVHTSSGANPGSTADVHLPAVVGHFSILDALARLVGLVIASQLLQHDDGPNASLSYRVGHRLRYVKSDHV
jgi:hypothetical protein